MGTSVVVARVSKTFGLGGEVIINLYDTFPENFNIEEPLFVSIDSLTVPLFLDSFHRRGRSSALVRFADFDTPERVGELISLELSMKTTPVEVPQRYEDEIYPEDFVGFTARFEGKEYAGTIESFIESEHNPLFLVVVDGVDVFVPVVDEFILSFDMSAAEIIFDLPEGLLDLYL